MSTHRVRQRRRVQQQPAPVAYEPDTTELELAELSVLWPRLEEAVARDTAGPSAAPSGGGSGSRHSRSVIDVDTEDVRVIIATGVRRVEVETVRLLNITPAWRAVAGLRAQIQAHAQRRATAKATAQRIAGRTQGRRATVDEHVSVLDAVLTVVHADAAIESLLGRVARVQYRNSTAGVVELLPTWYAAMRDRELPYAQKVADEVRRWHRDARRVLGLRTREVSIGWHCPHHRDAPATLVRPADEAVLSPAITAGSHPRSDPPLRWRRYEKAFCPGCGQSWSGVEQLRVLMRMIDQVEEDEAMRVEVLAVVRTMAAENADEHSAPLWRNELALLEAIGIGVETCSGECGCRRGTNDPDRLDCACAGECTSKDVHSWFVFELALPERYRKRAVSGDGR